MRFGNKRQRATWTLVTALILGMGCGIEGPVGMTGSQGPMGSNGTDGSPDAPAQVLDKFNSAVAAGGRVSLGPVVYTDAAYDIRWALASAAAISICSSKGGVAVIPFPFDISCSAACAANTKGMFTNCAAMIRVNGPALNKPQSLTDNLGFSYKYACSDVRTGGNPVDPKTQPGDAGYCCCY